MNTPLKIKICGMRFPENLEEVCSLGPDYVGFIFYEGSKRFVGHKPDPVLFEIPKEGIKKVGVFVNEELARVRQVFKDFQLELVQLHGSESPEYCKTLMEAGIPVIKAFDPEFILRDNPAKGDAYRIEEYEEVVQFLLFDTPGPGYGGTGQKFDWHLIKGNSISLPFLLSGGIGPEDVAAVRDVNHESYLGVDVNSRFELSPGLKNIQRLKDFIREIRK